jgi:hypothetical protein
MPRHSLTIALLVSALAAASAANAQGELRVTEPSEVVVPEYAIAGELVSVHPTTMTMVIRPVSGAAEAITFEDRTTVYLGEGLATPASLAGSIGSSVVVSDRNGAAERIATTVRAIGSRPLNILEGKIAWLDLKRLMVLVKPKGRVEQAFWFSSSIIFEAGAGVVPAAGLLAREGDRVAVYYTDEGAGRKVVHLFRHIQPEMTN